MFNKILVAVDGSKTALAAVAKAVELQKLTHAELYLLCVYKHHSLFEASLSLERGDGLQLPDEELTQYARDVVEQAKSHALALGAEQVRGFIKAGRPSSAIVEYAREHGVDLIVLGTHGTHSRDGMFLGSVAHRVSAQATCSVLIV